jgi:hypothetical protein
MRVCALGQLAMRQFQIGQQLCAIGRQVRRVAMLAAEVVYADEHQRMGDAGARQHVAVEARGKVGAQAVAQHAPAANAGVDHAQRLAVLTQACRQHVGPAVIAVGGHAIAVGDGIADRNDRAGTARRLNFDVAQRIPARDLARLGPCRLHHLVALGEEALGAGAGMAGLARRFAFEVQRDREIGGRFEFHGDGVAVVFSARRNHDVGTAIEGQWPQGRGVDVGFARGLGQRDAGAFQQ